MVRIKRIYEPPAKGDGFRLLVDRLWPRGLSKESAQIDLWFKEIAPSTKLRKWFGHDPARWEIFQKKYTEELKGQPQLLKQLRALVKREGTVTLLYGAKNERLNQAVVLRELI